MSQEDINVLKSIAKRIRGFNKKFKLVVLLKRAKKAYDNNNYKGCYEACRKILEQEPTNAIAYRGLGCVEQASGNYRKAVEYYEKALKTSQNKEVEYTLIGTVYYLQDSLDKAIKYYNMAIDTNDDYDLAYDGKNQSMLERHLQIADLQDSLIKRKIF